MGWTSWVWESAWYRARTQRPWDYIDLIANLKLYGRRARNKFATYRLWGSPHGHWYQIHWIQIPDPDLILFRVSSTWHADYTHCTAELDLKHCHAAQHTASFDPYWGLVETKRSLHLDPDPHQIQIRICIRSGCRSGSKVLCGGPPQTPDLSGLWLVMW